MLPLLILGIAAVGGLALSGCATVSRRREYFPKNPSPDDPLAQAPCSLKQEPEITFVQSQPLSAPAQENWRKRIRGDLEELRKIHPALLCGLERVEILDQKEFSKVEDNPETRAHYDPEARVIRVRQYSRKTLFHEFGHHLHNLGILAPTVNQTLAWGWRSSPGKADPEAVPGWFWTPYSKKSPREDWAETFAMVGAFPLEAGLKVYYPPPIAALPGGNPSQKFSWEGDNPPEKFSPGRMLGKIDPLYQRLNLPRLPGREVGLEVGSVRGVGPSALGWAEGNEIFLYEGEGMNWTGIGPNLSYEMKSWPRIPVESGEVFQTVRLGESRVFACRTGYMDTKSSGAGIGLLIQRTPASPLIRVPKESGTILGELHILDKEVGYFTREESGVAYRALHPPTGQIRPLANWRLPEGFVPLHAVVLEERKEWAIAGMFTDRDRLEVIRVRADAKSSENFSLIRGGGVALPEWRKDEILFPVRHGERLIFPFRTFQFLAYDLRGGEFEILNPRFTGLPQELRGLHTLLPNQGRLLALGTDAKGNTLSLTLTLRE